MEEAEYCDHVAILDHGRVLAHGSPAEIRRHARATPGHEPTITTVLQNAHRTCYA
jgi:ABC-2 type transport system ATP-binding protein